MSRRITLSALAVLLSLPLTSAAVLAAGPALPPSAAVLNELIAGWRSAGAEVKAGPVTPLAGDDRIEIRDLSITLPPPPAPAAGPAAPPAVLSFARLELSGLARTGTGYAVRAADVSGFGLTGAGGALALAALRLEGLDLPLQGWPSFDAAKPTASLVAAMKALGRVALARGEAGALTLTPPGAPAPILALTSLTVRDIGRGRIEEFGLGRFTVPGFDLDGASLKAFDLAAVQRVLDTATYRPIPPERLWMPVAGSVALGALRQTGPGQVVQLAGATLTGLQIRTFASDVPAALDANAGNPAYFAANAQTGRAIGAELTDALLVDGLTLKGLSVAPAAPPVRRVGCDDISLTALTLRAVQTATARGCAVDAANDVALRVAELTLRDLSADRIVTAAVADPASVDFAPTLGQLSLGGVALTQAGATVNLARLNLGMANPVRGIPTRLDLAVEKLDTPLGTVSDPNLRAALTSLGMQTVSVDIAAKLGWRETARELDVEQASITLAQYGRLSASATFTDVPRTAFENPATARDVAAASSLRRFKLTYDDNSLATRLLTLFAAANKQTPDDLRKAISRVVPNILASVPDTVARGKLTFALLSFINAPGALELSSGIVEPVPVAKLVDTARTGLPNLPGLLKLNATTGKSALDKGG
jgi:hypothetical protein